MKKTLATLVCLTCSLPVFAANYKGETPAPAAPTGVYMGLYGGYGDVDGAYKNDGEVTEGRFALGYQFYNYDFLGFGAEVGVQSGNTMRLSASDAVIEAGGGLPVQATLKPLVDVLLTVKGALTTSMPVVVILKGGIAYRQLQLEDRSSHNDSLRKVNGEFQAGLGYPLTEHAMLTAYYQGIYSESDAGVSVDSTGNYTSISHIPTENSGFLGLEISL